MSEQITPLKWDSLNKQDQEKIRQAMLKEMVRTIKATLPTESGTTCHMLAIRMVDKAIERERAKESHGKGDTSSALVM